MIRLLLFWIAIDEAKERLKCSLRGHAWQNPVGNDAYQIRGCRRCAYTEENVKLKGWQQTTSFYSHVC
jgi:hypothetical protein